MSTARQRQGWLPHLRFRSIARPGPTPSGLRGLLDLGGTPRVQTLDTLAATRRTDTITGTDLAMFDLTAEVGLTQRDDGLARMLVGDTARLHLTMTTEIEPGL